MSKYSIEQYIEMSIRFNKLSFIDKIKTIRENTGIMTLASDGNWWGVRVIDGSINEQLEKQGILFLIDFEWGSSEMCDLVSLLGIGNTDI